MSLNLSFIYSDFNFTMDKSPHHKIYEFENFRLDTAQLMLYRDAEEISLAPKAVETLVALIERRGEILSKDMLMETIWTDAVVEESNLAKYLHILRKTLGNQKNGKPFIETFRRRGYRFNGLVSVLDPLPESQPKKINQNYPMLQRPAYDGAVKEATSGRVIALADWRRETEEEKPMSPAFPAEQGKKTIFPLRKMYLLFAAAGFVLFVLAFFALDKFRSEIPVKNEPVKTIAVLPFKPLAAENRDEALEMGMADTLISKLGNNREITVRPLSSVRRYGNLEQDALLAGRELGVDSVLEGSIQRRGDKIRVNVRMLKTSDGRLLWTETFDENFTDIFVVQDAISNKVAAALSLHLNGDEKMRLTKHPTEYVRAYEFYLKGRFHVLKLTLPDIRRGISYFEQAIEADPNYALAYVGLADAYRSMFAHDINPNEFLPQAKAAAHKAIEIDPTLADAFAQLGYIVFWHDWDWKTAENHFRRALELDPNNADAYLFYGHLLSNTGRHAESIAMAERARELDPLNLRTNALEGQFRFYAGHHDEAINSLQKTLELEPNYGLARFNLSNCYIEKGKLAEAGEEIQRIKLITGNNAHLTMLEGYILARSGKRAEAGKLLEDFLKRANERFVPPYSIAMIYNGLGETEKALTWLERSFEQRDQRMVFLKIEPKWKNLRNEPRFISLLKRMNFE